MPTVNRRKSGEEMPSSVRNVAKWGQFTSRQVIISTTKTNKCFLFFLFTEIQGSS